jgi:hypothetical protein
MTKKPITTQPRGEGADDVIGIAILHFSSGQARAYTPRNDRKKACEVFKIISRMSKKQAIALSFSRSVQNGIK